MIIGPTGKNDKTWRSKHIEQQVKQKLLCCDCSDVGGSSKFSMLKYLANVWLFFPVRHSR